MKSEDLTRLCESDLQCYIDGELPPDDHQAFETLLSHESELSVLACLYLQQKRTLRRLVDTIPMPPPPRSLPPLVQQLTEHFRRTAPAAKF